MRKMGFLFLALAVISISGCTVHKGTFEGDTYINKTCGISIVPPQGWSVKEQQNFFNNYVFFYSPMMGRATITISVTKFPIEFNSETGIPRDEIITAMKSKFGQMGLIVLDESKGQFYDAPAYIIDFTNDSVPKVEGKIYLMVRNKGYDYVVTYYAMRDEYYSEVIDWIDKSLSTLKFQK